jgi:hypothetical protein
MKLGTYVPVSVDELRKNRISTGKTSIQKLIYFALQLELRI